jgi:hypothetical protein
MAKMQPIKHTESQYGRASDVGIFGSVKESHELLIHLLIGSMDQ